MGFQMAKPMKSRYVKFVMDQCYGHSGGLNYFQAFGSSFSSGSLPPAQPVTAQVIHEFDTYDSRFLGRNVLDAAWQGGSHYNGQTWLTRHCDRGGHFIMKLASITMVQEFHLLNTCNTPYNDRSTKDFSIFVSMDNNEYSLAHKGSLDRCTPIKGEPLVFKNTGPMQAQYVKFVMDKCYGGSGGLNYFQPFGNTVGGTLPPAEGISAKIIQAHNEYDGRFRAKNVLSPEWQGGSHHNGQTWLTRSCNDGWFVMDLSATKMVQEFHMLNTCNTPYNDRSTKDFTIYVSEDNNNWDLALKGQLDHCAPIRGEPRVFKNTGEMKARYIKFVMDRCYGASGGLNYFQAFGSDAP